MDTRTLYSHEVRERSVRLVQEQAPAHGSQWAAVQSIAVKVGCTAETVRCRTWQAERDGGRRLGLTTEEQQRVKRCLIGARR